MLKDCANKSHSLNSGEIEIEVERLASHQFRSSCQNSQLSVPIL